MAKKKQKATKKPQTNYEKSSALLGQIESVKNGESKALDLQKQVKSLMNSTYNNEVTKHALHECAVAITQEDYSKALFFARGLCIHYSENHTSESYNDSTD